MTKKALIFIRDYTDQGKDRFFLWFEKVLKEVSAEDISSQTEELVCHDYWLIAPIIFRLTGRLPKIITDVEELRISISGKRSEREKKRKDRHHQFASKAYTQRDHTKISCDI